MKKTRFFIPLILLSTAFLFNISVAQTTTPVPVQISDRFENIGGRYYHQHTVEKGQTLYSIARAYQVSIDQIRRTITDKPEIQIGEILLIPANARRIRQRPPPIETTISPIEPTVSSEEPETQTLDTTRKNFDNPPKSELNVALMLPLYLNEVEQIRITPRTNRDAIRPFSFVSFYEGAKLAAQAFEDESTPINVHVFDVTEDINFANRLINSERLNDMDIIVGPLFSRSFSIMSDFAKQREIFIVNPLSNRDDILDDNPFVIKINTSERNKLQVLLNCVAEKNIGQRILILSNDSLTNENEWAKQAELFFEQIEDQFDTIIFFDISKERFPRFQSNLSDVANNAIIYLSTDEAFATQILTRTPRFENAVTVLHSLRKLSRFEVTEPVFLNNLQTHYIDPFFINHDDERVKNFDRLFFETFETIPDPWAYRGFDVMSYVLYLLKFGNTNYGNLLEPLRYRGFHNNIRLQRANPTQGLENQETNILKVENSRLRKVNN